MSTPSGRKLTQIEWIDSLPEHWDVVPLSTQTVERRERNSGLEEDRVLSLSYGNIVERDVESGEGLLPESFETYQIVEPGNLILRLTDLQNDQRSLRVGHSPYRGIITSAYVCLETRPSFDDRYAYYLLHSYDTTKVFYGMGAGVRQTMGYADLKQVLVPVPPIEAQRGIADFLDRETAKIDTLIEKKKRLLELLDEKRTALITRAVTRGLDPDLPMKDSGVEWIGEIPEHWEVVPLRRIARVVDCKHRTPTYVPEGYPLVSTTEVKPGILDLSVCTRFVGEDDFADMTEGLRLPQRGDIIYSRNASLGAAALVEADEPFCMGQDVVMIRANENPDFLCQQLNSPVVTSQVEAVGVGSTFSRINVATIRNLQVALPPTDEQRRIAEDIRAVTSELRRVAAKTGKAMSLLKEYRTALISAAVTGALDVRQSRLEARQLAFRGAETKRDRVTVEEV